MTDMQKRILIADDEKDLVYLLCVRLTAMGYDTLVAHDGHECLEKAKTERPDLILLDVVMPKLNGHQVRNALREDPTTSHIPIIMLTAAVRNPDEELPDAATTDEYMVKPYEMAELMRKIQTLLSLL